MVFKKRQTAIFIITILIVSFVVFSFVFKTNIKKEKTIFLEPSQTKNSIQECIDEQLSYGVLLVMSQGGYYIHSRESFSTEFQKIAYGYQNEKNSLVDLSDMENQISFYLSDVLPICINETLFPDLLIRYKEASIKTKIENTRVYAKVV